MGIYTKGDDWDLNQVQFHFSSMDRYALNCSQNSFLVLAWIHCGANSSQILGPHARMAPFSGNNATPKVATFYGQTINFMPFFKFESIQNWNARHVLNASVECHNRCWNWSSFSWEGRAPFDSNFATVKIIKIGSGCSFLLSLLFALRNVVLQWKRKTFQWNWFRQFQIPPHLLTETPTLAKCCNF